MSQECIYQNADYRNPGPGISPSVCLVLNDWASLRGDKNLCISEAIALRVDKSTYPRVYANLTRKLRNQLKNIEPDTIKGNTRFWSTKTIRSEFKDKPYFTVRYQLFTDLTKLIFELPEVKSSVDYIAVEKALAKMSHQTVRELQAIKTALENDTPHKLLKELRDTSKQTRRELLIKLWAAKLIQAAPKAQMITASPQIASPVVTSHTTEAVVKASRPSLRPARRLKKRILMVALLGVFAAVGVAAIRSGGDRLMTVLRAQGIGAAVTMLASVDINESHHTYFDAGWTYFTANDYDTAQSIFTELSLESDVYIQARAQYMLGEIYHIRNDLKKAMAHFMLSEANYLRLDMPNGQARCLLGRAKILMTEGRAEESLELIKSTQEISEPTYDYFKLEAMVHYILKDYEKAEEIALTLLGRDNITEETFANSFLGLVYIFLGDLELGRSYTQIADDIVNETDDERLRHENMLNHYALAIVDGNPVSTKLENDLINWATSESKPDMMRTLVRIKSDLTQH